MIDSFTGEYKFLSNFYLHPVLLDKFPLEFPSSEHAFQWHKVNVEHPDAGEWRHQIRTARSPGESKRLGRRAPVRPDWDIAKDSVMLYVLTEKFKDAKLGKMILTTGDSPLVEGNYWHDNYWGMCYCDRCPGEGYNHLGRLLTIARDSLQVGK